MSAASGAGAGGRRTGERSRTGDAGAAVGGAAAVGATPALLEPSTPEELSAVVAEAGAAGRVLLPLGHGSRAGPAAQPLAVDARLSTRRLDALVHHEPGDLTATVQAGVPLATLSAHLAAHGQWLPHQPYRGRGTIGGLLASGADGALDLGYGRLREVVLGARAVHGDGALTRSRGRVVKNVAGYDVPRLMAGSLGTLGVLVELSLKLQPLPERQACAAFALPSVPAALAAAGVLHDAPLQPVLLDVLADDGGGPAQVVIGFDGRSARVEGLLQRCRDLLAGAGVLGDELLDGQGARALRARLDDPFALATGDPRPAVGLRFSGLPVRTGGFVAAAQGAADEHGATLLLDARPPLGLAFATLRAGDEAALRGASEAALAAGRRLGAVVRVRAPSGWPASPADVWGPAPPDHVVMERVREALDPAGVFARGRFVGGL